MTKTYFPHVLLYSGTPREVRSSDISSSSDLHYSFPTEGLFIRTTRPHRSNQYRRYALSLGSFVSSPGSLPIFYTTFNTIEDYYTIMTILTDSYEFIPGFAREIELWYVTYKTRNFPHSEKSISSCE